MATINDLHSQLEQLNESIGQMVSMRQQQSMEDRRGGGEQKSFITSVAKNIIASPLEAVKEFSLLSLKVGFQMVESVDRLEMSNISDGRITRSLLKEINDESGEQIGGVLENLEMMTTASEKGIDLRGQDNKILRNQLTTLNKSGVQGQLLLNFTKDLVGQGFKKEQVKETLQRLADIGFYSIQSATSQANMLKRMNETMGITALADPAFGDDLRLMMTDMFHDAPPEWKNAVAEVMKMMILPEGVEEIQIREAMGGDAALAELRLLSESFSEATDRGDEEAKVDIQKQLEDLVAGFSEKGLKEAEKYLEGTEAVSQGLMRMLPFFSTQFRMIETFNLASAAAERVEELRLERLAGDDTFAGGGVGVPPGNAFERMVEELDSNLFRVGERIQEQALKNIQETSKMLKDGLIIPIEGAAKATTTMSKWLLLIPSLAAGIITSTRDMVSGARTFKEIMEGVQADIRARGASPPVPTPRAPDPDPDPDPDTLAPT